jgi:hypothetical protein
MTNVKRLFRKMLRDRRAWPKGSDEWDWRTRAARQYLEIMQKPVTSWPKTEETK